MNVELDLGQTEVPLLRGATCAGAPPGVELVKRFALGRTCRWGLAGDPRSFVPHPASGGTRCLAVGRPNTEISGEASVAGAGLVRSNSLLCGLLYSR